MALFRWLSRFIAPRDTPADPPEWEEYAAITEALRNNDLAKLDLFARTVPGFPHGNDRPLGRSWLVNAIDLGGMESIVWVLDQIRRVEFYDEDERSPLTAAIERQWPVLGHQDDTHKVVALLIERGACVDTPDPTFGNTPLHVAAAHGTAKTINLLLDFGADPLAWNKDSFGPEQPVGFVDAKKRPEIHELLLSAMRSAEMPSAP